ncbi:hypothetical protein FKM82_012013 [Ascaphus truei]
MPTTTTTTTTTLGQLLHPVTPLLPPNSVTSCVQKSTPWSAEEVLSGQHLMGSWMSLPVYRIQAEFPAAAPPIGDWENSFEHLYEGDCS